MFDLCVNPQFNSHNQSQEGGRVYQDLLIGRPGIESQAKVMETTTDRHHHIPRGISPEPNRILDNAAALDRADNVFNAHPTMRNHPVLSLLLLG